MICHVMREADWETAKHKADYEGDTLHSEGFIHCSTRDQVAGVVNRYFQPGDSLVVLHIDEGKVVVPIKYEASTGGEFFPHVYGSIPMAAVTRVEPWQG